MKKYFYIINININIHLHIYPTTYTYIYTHTCTHTHTHCILEDFFPPSPVPPMEPCSCPGRGLPAPTPLSLQPSQRRRRWRCSARTRAMSRCPGSPRAAAGAPRSGSSWSGFPQLHTARRSASSGRKSRTRTRSPTSKVSGSTGCSSARYHKAKISLGLSPCPPLQGLGAVRSPGSRRERSSEGSRGVWSPRAQPEALEQVYSFNSSL